MDAIAGAGADENGAEWKKFRTGRARRSSPACPNLNRRVGTARALTRSSFEGAWSKIVQGRGTFLQREGLARVRELEMAIGRRLRAEYDAVTQQPLPPQLAVLREQLEPSDEPPTRE